MIQKKPIHSEASSPQALQLTTPRAAHSSASLEPRPHSAWTERPWLCKGLDASPVCPVLQLHPCALYINLYMEPAVVGAAGLCACGWAATGTHHISAPVPAPENVGEF